MEFKNFWIWGIDKVDCINSQAIKYFDIVKQSDPITPDIDTFIVYANLADRSIVISRHDTKQKAIDRIDNVFMVTGRCF